MKRPQKKREYVIATKVSGVLIKRWYVVKKAGDKKEMWVWSDYIVNPSASAMFTMSEAKLFKTNHKYLDGAEIMPVHQLKRALIAEELSTR